MMIPTSMALMWQAVANHLWQSTLFAVIAGLLTLALRKNQARTRYWLWLASSVKFLIPFSLLVSLGSHLARPRSLIQAQPGFYFAVDQLSQPFTYPATSAISTAASSPAHLSFVPLLPAILMAVWLCGFLAVLFVWCVRWRKISLVMREALPLREGREVQALRRMEKAAGMRKPLQLLLSPASLEPGIFGIVRPVLLWPERISERLENAHLEAILAHELWHVRRRDNLTAAIHMFVEAVFWFHPLVWWVGSRLVEERERACDEEVLQSGNRPQIYAESILKTCEFCIESPLECVSGVTGANLKKRIVNIMTQPLTEKLSGHRKLLLAALCIVMVAGPVVFGLVRIPQLRAQLLQATGSPLPSFEVASIKRAQPGDNAHFMKISPARFSVENQDVRNLIKFAYNFNSDDQLSGAPGWINSEKYDVDAKVADSLVADAKRLPFDQRTNQFRLMVQSLLADRFQLKVSYQAKELPVYALVITKGGPKLIQSAVAPLAHARRGTWGGRGELIGTDASIALLVDVISREPEMSGRAILDETGLKDTYDWSLHWSPESPALPFNVANGGPNTGQGSANPPPDSSGPSLFTALQEQLGLRLVPTKGPVEVLVIDHIERPTPN